MEGTENKNEEIVKFLLKKGASINAVDYLGHNPLVDAVRNKRFKVIKIVLARLNLSDMQIAVRMCW